MITVKGIFTECGGPAENVRVTMQPYKAGKYKTADGFMGNNPTTKSTDKDGVVTFLVPASEDVTPECLYSVTWTEGGTGRPQYGRGRTVWVEKEPPVQLLHEMPLDSPKNPKLRKSTGWFRLVRAMVDHMTN